MELLAKMAKMAKMVLLLLLLLLMSVHSNHSQSVVLQHSQLILFLVPKRPVHLLLPAVLVSVVKLLQTQ